MYDNDPDTKNYTKIRNIIIAIVAAVILLIITISVVAINANKDEATIVNESGRDSEIISDEDLAEVKSRVYAHTKNVSQSEEGNNDNNGNTYDGDVSAAVRWNTVKSSDDSTTFLIDLDDYQQTYRVYVTDGETFLTCPKISESKYPESFCIGTSGDIDDSITAVFGANLPYTGQTNSGYTYTIARNENSRKNGSLYILSYSCQPAEKVSAEVSQSVDTYITSFGAPTTLFIKDISVVCPHGE